MQTFLPYMSYKDTAKCLDDKRLGKQRVEALQIMQGSWPHHPATKMWQGYNLLPYLEAIIDEWLQRGYDDNVWAKAIKLAPNHNYQPKWLGSKIHETHRAALLYKYPKHYNTFGWSEYPMIYYYWP